jgi:hypothetical protein
MVSEPSSSKRKRAHLVREGYNESQDHESEHSHWIAVCNTSAMEEQVIWYLACIHLADCRQDTASRPASLSLT